MPNYLYRCNNCEHSFYEYQSINDNPLKKCPECKKRKLFRVIGRVEVSIPKTLGSLAEKNSRELGRLGVEQKEKERKEEIQKAKTALLPPNALPLKKPTKKPWYWSGNDRLKLSDVKNVKKYIMTGDKN